MNSSPYLHWCYTRLKTIKGSLFIHGFSFDDKDKHIHDAIFKNQKLTQIFVGLFKKDEASVENKIRSNPNFRKAQVTFYDSESIYEDSSPSKT
ncbi:MAG: DUF4917 family protein [Alphaproteobacteria bacterium]